MRERALEGIRACVFDAYGTLFDYASAAARCADVLGADFQRLSALWREKQLQYTWLRACQHRHADFWQVTGDALDFALESLGIPAGEIAFISANGWDAYAASAFGMRVVWCNRYDQRPERLPGTPDRVVSSLADLPALVGATR